jgi:hypothetical protein
MVEVKKMGWKIILLGRTNEIGGFRLSVCSGCALSSLDFFYNNEKGECQPRWQEGKVAECLRYR